MEKLRTIYMYILGALIFVGFFVAIYILIFVPIPAFNENMLYMLLGILGAKFSDVIAYFYGSSSASMLKNETINKMANKP